MSSSLLGVYFQDHVLSIRGGHPNSLINNHETIFESSIYQGHPPVTYIHKVVACNNSLNNFLSVFVMRGSFPEDVMAGRNVKIGSGDEQGVTSLTDTYQVYELRRQVALGTATRRSLSDRSLSRGARRRAQLDNSLWNDGVAPGEPGEQEDLIVYIDLEFDALMARVQLISYRYILL